MRKNNGICGSSRIETMRCPKSWVMTTGGQHVPQVDVKVHGLHARCVTRRQTGYARYRRTTIATDTPCDPMPTQNKDISWREKRKKEAGLSALAGPSASMVMSKARTELSLSLQ